MILDIKKKILRPQWIKQEPNNSSKTINYRKQLVTTDQNTSINHSFALTRSSKSPIILLSFPDSKPISLHLDRISIDQTKI
jgi:hypothetical protein